ncbi:nucleotidyltransferase domain-containing protein [Sphingomonas sp. MS122]|uniref:nucleotidyltransferase domain-containing protein n=1 Tax=Sphingomonas sp. MS122 TaxID=3412683 RepID=UPI003C2C5AC6
MREAASGTIDWPRVERIARRHRVTALVQNGLIGPGMAVPDATAQRLADEARRLRMTALAMAREAVLLQDAFDAAGCPALFVKGASLGVLAYGDIGLKQAWDIDLLTTPESAAHGRAILERNGYALVEPASLDGHRFKLFMELAKECVLVHPAKRIAVELHWRLVDNPHLLPGVDARSPTQAVAIGAQQLRTLTDTELLAYLTVHGTRSAWVRLKWLADVAALLSRYEAAELDGLYRRLHALGTGRAAGVALLLCHQLLGVALPGALLAELRDDRRTERLAATAVAALTYGEGEGAFPDHSRLGFRVRFARLGIAPGWRYLAAELASLWRSPVDRLALPLPRRLAFLYHVLRIPLWMYRRLAALRRPPSPEPG